MDAALLINALVWLPWVVLGASVVAVGAVLAGRWQLGKRAARLAVLAVLPYPVLLVLVFSSIADAAAPHDATLIAKGISEAASTAALAALGALMSVVIWIAAARRERAQHPPARSR